MECHSISLLLFQYEKLCLQPLTPLDPALRARLPAEPPQQLHHLLLAHRALVALASAESVSLAPSVANELLQPLQAQPLHQIAVHHGIVLLQLAQHVLPLHCLRRLAHRGRAGREHSLLIPVPPKLPLSFAATLMMSLHDF